MAHDLSDSLLELHQRCRRWIELASPEMPHPTHRTEAYADLTFAFGLARLGDPDASRLLLQRGQQALDTDDLLHRWMGRAYAYRVEQALAGQPHLGPLPPDIVRKRGHLPFIPLGYNADQFRYCLRVLEPEQGVHPLNHLLHEKGAESSVPPEVVALLDCPDFAEVARQLEQIVAALAPGRRKLTILTNALALAPRFDAGTVERVLDALAPCIEAQPGDEDGVGDRLTALRSAFAAAAHAQSASRLDTMVRHFVALLDSILPEEVIKNERCFGDAVEACFRALNRIGDRKALTTTFACLGDMVRRTRAAADPHHQGPWGRDCGRLLLPSAALGWACLGEADKALPVLEEICACLRQLDGLMPPGRASLACGYATAVGYLPLLETVRHLEALFENLVPLPDHFNTATHAGRLQLVVVEAAMLALMKDDFSLGRITVR